MKISSLGLTSYENTFLAMREFTENRTAKSDDEIWCVEHYPVFTLGQAGDRRHVLAQSDIPIVETDRGGQVTYHGPGQAILYVLLDLKRMALGVKALVKSMEQSVIDMVAEYDVVGERVPGAPGVYVAGEKICALGLRIRKGCSYHGLALNVNMDMSPFTLINPCGYAGLRTTQLVDLGISCTTDSAARRVGEVLMEQLENR